LRGIGHTIGHNLVGDLLRKLGYSLQANRKTREGTNHPDRDAQFRYINDRVKAASTRVSRRFPSTPRKRSWSAISRTPAASGRQKVRLKKCVCTISSFQNWDALHPMASMISATTPDGERWRRP